MHHIKYKASERMGFQSLNLLKRRFKIVALLVFVGLLYNRVSNYSPPPTFGKLLGLRAQLRLF